MLGVSFRRIQFTPDLMPADIVGVNTYNLSTAEFSFQSGPIFADVILADEINRAPAKTQSALLEAMQEGQVTVDGTTYDMSPVFTVFATQNPVEFEGTYRLPEAQVDRFMLKIAIGYPEADHEAAILDKVEDGFDAQDLETIGLQRVLDSSALQGLRAVVAAVPVEKSVRRYVTRIVRATRQMVEVSLGASPRAGVMLLRASRAQAVLAGRQFVTPDDVKAMAPASLRHRLTLEPEVEVEGRTADELIERLLQSVEVPR